MNIGYNRQTPDERFESRTTMCDLIASFHSHHTVSPCQRVLRSHQRPQLDCLMFYSHKDHLLTCNESRRKHAASKHTNPIVAAPALEMTLLVKFLYIFGFCATTIYSIPIFPRSSSSSSLLAPREFTPSSSYDNLKDDYHNQCDDKKLICGVSIAGE